MTFPRAESDLLIFAPSFNVAPDAPVDFALKARFIFLKGKKGKGGGGSGLD